MLLGKKMKKTHKIQFKHYFSNNNNMNAKNKMKFNWKKNTLKFKKIPIIFNKEKFSKVQIRC